MAVPLRMATSGCRTENHDTHQGLSDVTSAGMRTGLGSTEATKDIRNRRNNTN